VEEFTSVSRLAARGGTPTTIARETGIPRSTIRDWLSGTVPACWEADAETTCTRCGHVVHAASALPDEYVYLLGIYLGDGCISNAPRGVFRLRIVLDLQHPAIIDECVAAMKAVMPANKVHRLPRSSNYTKSLDKTHVELSSYSKSWPCLFPQHGPGRKHERTIELVDWQIELVRRRPDLLLRGLIHSDGCRFMNTGRGGWRHPRYVFSNQSADILQIFRDACDMFGVRWTNSRNAVYVSRVADVARLDEVIGPKA
jgi:hypothetical protein